MEQLGLPSKTGYVRPTLDFNLLDQLKQKEKIQRPKFLYSEKNKQAKLTHTFFVEYQDTTRGGPDVCISDPKYPEYLKRKESVNDIVIIPFEFELRFDMSVKDNGEGLFSSPQFSLKKSNTKIG